MHATNHPPRTARTGAVPALHRPAACCKPRTHSSTPASKLTKKTRPKIYTTTAHQQAKDHGCCAQSVPCPVASSTAQCAQQRSPPCMPVPALPHGSLQLAQRTLQVQENLTGQQAQCANTPGSHKSMALGLPPALLAVGCGAHSWVIEIVCLCWLLTGGVLDVKKVGRALSQTGELPSGVEKWISGFH
jgi:hypothetical protein